MTTEITKINSILPPSLLLEHDVLARSLQQFDPEFALQVFVPYSKGKPLSAAVASGAPSFNDVSNFFSERATLYWLRFHIAETFAFLGIYDKATVYQIRATAELILSHEIFCQLTLDEFLCFLNRFKRGDYGKVYNSTRPNPQEFLVCLRQFWQELSLERARHAEQQKADRLSEEKRSAAPLTDEQQQHIAEIQQRLAEKFNLNIK